MFLFCLVFAMFCARLFICASWSPAGKGLTSWLSFVVSSVSLSLSHWYPGFATLLLFIGITFNKLRCNSNPYDKFFFTHTFLLLMQFSCSDSV